MVQRSTHASRYGLVISWLGWLGMISGFFFANAAASIICGTLFIMARPTIDVSRLRQSGTFLCVSILIIGMLMVLWLFRIIGLREDEYLIPLARSTVTILMLANLIVMIKIDASKT